MMYTNQVFTFGKSFKKIFQAKYTQLFGIAVILLAVQERVPPPGIEPGSKV